MRSGAKSFEPAPADLLALARVAQEAMSRSMATIDAAMQAVDQSNARIKAMEARNTRASADCTS
jgi:hypothetical protein